MRLQIKDIKIIDPLQNRDLIGDIFVENGRIVSKFLGDADKVVDGRGKIAVPGLIDIHSHLREPGEERKETIYTGTRSAAKGGITTVFCMPNTKPVIDNAPTVEFVLLKAQKEGLVNVFPIGCATKGSHGVEISEIGVLKKAGIVAVSDDGLPIANSQIMRRTLEYTKMFKLPVISHGEDKELSKNGVMNEGKNSMMLGLRGIPKQAEEVIISRDIMLADLTGGYLHIAHVSTAGSVELIRQAKKKSIKVTAETCPHYFTLTDDIVKGYNTNTKMNPPLRRQEDVDAIKQGLADGTIDCIATDHAPHMEEEKNREFDLAPFGIIGFETILSLILNELVDSGVLSLSKALSKMTSNPAKIFNLEGRGTLKEGNIADITIIDMKYSYEFKKENIVSKSKNSPFIGRKFKGGAVMTIVGGNIVWQV
ncbi:dihydroorotase [Endomicrobiia bacterium]|uniref:dihydroorotase n=1 Tax=Endomicrobium trichonymphae TaxID=1408204 RepID=UPI000864B909|nr:dihydroorotase [Candidatus Endomicrobium trichonymphae]GHT04697.1 dihydroorotase [Endomicrobiia bacterium]BAV59285.1 dihydroorotase [Candidatus Endomicrobium trichonymphae]GHT07675.1 dihydroorotase [Endomicrobiia bacterium]GHT11993.1 dihydroorotase [Endomicrobiia bacterium]GHT20951.1 dihydroorotase [Endomicrobiia bacterium]